MYFLGLVETAGHAQTLSLGFGVGILLSLPLQFGFGVNERDSKTERKRHVWRFGVGYLSSLMELDQRTKCEVVITNNCTMYRLYRGQEV